MNKGGVRLIEDIILAFSSGWILRKYFQVFFEERRIDIKGRIVWLIYFFWQYMLLHYEFHSIPFSLLISSFTIMCICLVQYKGDVGKKALFTFLVCSLWTIAEYVISYVFLLAGINYMVPKFIGTVMTQLLLTWIIGGVSRVLNKKNIRNLSKEYNMLLLLIPCSSMYIVTNIFIITAQMHTKNNVILAIISTCIIFAMNITIFIIYSKLSDEMELKRINSLYQQQLISYDIYLKEKEESTAEKRSLHHDLKQHFIYIAGLAKMQNYTEIITYIKKVLDTDIRYLVVAHSENMVIDAIVNYKVNVMKKNAIDFKLILEIPTKLEFQSTDICVILGNLLDNAIEASLKIKENRKITLIMKYIDGNLLIRVVNTYNGYLEKDKDGNVLTTKDKSEEHGIGIPSIQKSIQKYDGIMKIKNDHERFETDILLYGMQKEHEKR